jgi:hypothetical protein
MRQKASDVSNPINIVFVSSAMRDPFVPQSWLHYASRRMQVRLSGHCWNAAGCRCRPERNRRVSAAKRICMVANTSFGSYNTARFRHALPAIIRYNDNERHGSDLGCAGGWATHRCTMHVSMAIWMWSKRLLLRKQTQAYWTSNNQLPPRTYRLECLQQPAHPNSSSYKNRLGKSPMRKANEIGREAVEEFLRSVGVQADWEWVEDARIAYSIATCALK